MTGCPTCPETEHECRNWDWSGHCAECGEKTLPEWERELLARQAQAAQPDRPAPVDPSEVRIGDVVSAEFRMRDADIPPCTIEGETYVSNGAVKVGDEVIRWQSTGTASADLATVRILRRAESEPDPAAVEALAKILDSADLFVATAGERVETARRLIRDHGVYVEVPDA